MRYQLENQKQMACWESDMRENRRNVLQDIFPKDSTTCRKGYALYMCTVAYEKPDTQT